jgi:hypothetical protein
MATLGYTFDASAVEPDVGFEPLPAGDYPVIIVDSTMETTKSGTGQFLKLQLQVIDGPHQGATLFDRLNLINANPKAVEIAQRTLSSICHAIGKLQVADSEQLHNAPLVARVAYKPASGEYPAGNDIKGYKPANGQPSPVHAAPAPAPAVQHATAPQAKPTPASGGATPPWLVGKTAAA